MDFGFVHAQVHTTHSWKIKQTVLAYFHNTRHHTLRIKFLSFTVDQMTYIFLPCPFSLHLGSFLLFSFFPFAVSDGVISQECSDASEGVASDPLEVEQLTSEQKLSRFRSIRRDVISYIRQNAPDLLLRKFSRKEGSEKDIPFCLQKQANAIAAVMVYGSYAMYPQTVKAFYPVSGPSFSRMKARIEEENEDFSFGSLLSLEGRPFVYQPVVDHRFLLWMADPDTATIEKTVPNMVGVYIDIHSVYFGDEAGELLNEEGVRRHLTLLLRENGYRMRKPKIVDARRCIKREKLEKWFRDPAIRRCLDNAHPRLVFNADETEINRKGYFSGKVACRGKKQPSIAARDRSGSHVSLFITVSAASLSSRAV